MYVEMICVEWFSIYQRQMLQYGDASPKLWLHGDGVYQNRGSRRMISEMTVSSRTRIQNKIVYLTDTKCRKSSLPVWVKAG